MKIARIFLETVERDNPTLLQEEDIHKAYVMVKAYLNRMAIKRVLRENRMHPLSTYTGRDWSKGEMMFTQDIYQPFIMGWHGELYRALVALETWPDAAVDDHIRKLTAFYERDCPIVLEDDPDTLESYRLCKAHLAMMAMRPILDKAKAC